MAVLELTAKNFDEVVISHEMVLVDFWALWCGPCRAFGEIYETLSEKYKDIVFGKVDIDKEIQLKNDFNVRSIPLLMIFRGNIAVYKEAGALTATALETIIKEANALDLKEIRQAIAMQDSNKEESNKE